LGHLADFRIGQLPETEDRASTLYSLFIHGDTVAVEDSSE
jgi:hypothetical protein